VHPSAIELETSMQESDSPSLPVRPCGAGYCFETLELYVWEGTERDAARSAEELLDPPRAIGARPGDR